MLQLSVCTGEMCTLDRTIPFPSRTAWGAGGGPGTVGLEFGDQEEALEQQNWNLGAGGAPGTGIGNTAQGLVAHTAGTALSSGAAS